MQAAASAYPIFGTPRLAAEIVASLHEPFALLDSELRLVAASPSFYRRFGLEASAAVGSLVYDLGHGEWDTPGARHLLDDLAPRREVVEGYSLEVRGTAVERPRVVVSVRPVRHGENQITCYLLAFIDPAPAAPPDDVRVRRAPWESADLLAVIDPNGHRFATLDGAVRTLTGYAPGQLEGRGLGSFLHPDERRAILARLAGLGAGEPHMRLTFRFHRSDDRLGWLEAMCRAFVDETGETMIHLSARDVSDRKRAEEALRWLGRQTKLILDSAADGIVGVDPTGRITFINPAAARALGYRVPELLGREYRVIVPQATMAGEFAPTSSDEAVGGADSSPTTDSRNAARSIDRCGPTQVDEAVSLTLRDGVARAVRDTELRCGDGSAHRVEMSCNAAIEHGAISAVVVTFRGIAARKRAEAAALRAEWLAGVGETTLAVRHEINNPLTTLLAEARLLEMGANSAVDEREMVASICTQARRIGDVLRRLAERQEAPAVRIDGDQRMLDLR